MVTRFARISYDDPAGRRWSIFFYAGTDWLLTWQLLVDLRDDSRSMGRVPTPFYVDSYIIHFCVELFTKALVDHSNPGFDPKEFSHRTLDYIRKYQSASPIFVRIAGDAALCDLIREFEKTVDTRFGETYVVREKSDDDKMMGLVYEMRAELCRKTGLH